MHIIVKLMKTEEIQELKEAFQAIDTDNSGKLSIEELLTALQQVDVNIGLEEVIKVI